MKPSGAPIISEGPTDAGLALRALARYPDRVAFRSARSTMTYGEALSLIARLQRVLKPHGVGPATCVAILSSNRPESWCAVIAVQALGGAVTLLHPIAAREAQASQIIDSGSSVLIVDADQHVEHASELGQDCQSAILLTLGASPQGQDLLDLAAKVPPCLPIQEDRPDFPATMNYTGGTTGTPKGVVRTARAVACITQTVLADFDLPDCPQYLAVAPISHVAGTKIVPVLMKGGTIHLMKGFDPEKVLETISRERINMTLLVPTMVYMLLDHPRVDHYDLSSLGLVLYGAAPMLPSRLIEAIERFGPVFSQLYGQTECYPITLLPKIDHNSARPELLAACGHAVSSAQVSLQDDLGSMVPDGLAGEICVRGPMVMAGYWHRNGETEAVMRDGWLRTGDIAVRDAQGRLYIVDRKKDMIVTGGFNVYPREVEDVLASHPTVAVAAVVGIPDAKWGECVAAYIVPKAGVELHPSVLIDLVRTRKGTVHAPKHVFVVDTLPQTALGKIDKVALRAAHWEGHSRKV